MSRGPGRVQRRLLELFEKDPGAYGTALDLAVILYDVKPDNDGMRLVTDAQHSAVRRALMALYKRGKIRRDGFRSNGRQGWTLNNGTPDQKNLRTWAAELGVSKSTMARARAARRRKDPAVGIDAAVRQLEQWDLLRGPTQ